MNEYLLKNKANLVGGAATAPADPLSKPSQFNPSTLEQLYQNSSTLISQYKLQQKKWHQHIRQAKQNLAGAETKTAKTQIPAKVVQSQKENIEFFGENDKKVLSRMEINNALTQGFGKVALSSSRTKAV